MYAGTLSITQRSTLNTSARSWYLVATTNQLAGDQKHRLIPTAGGKFLGRNFRDSPYERYEQKVLKKTHQLTALLFAVGMGSTRFSFQRVKPIGYIGVVKLVEIGSRALSRILTYKYRPRVQQDGR